MKLIIRNIDRNVTESQLKLMFDHYGKVQSCSLVMDKVTGESKGFGFIEMPKQGEAKAAMVSVNGQNINGTKIRVKKAGH